MMDVMQRPMMEQKRKILIITGNEQQKQGTRSFTFLHNILHAQTSLIETLSENIQR